MKHYKAKLGSKDGKGMKGVVGHGPQPFDKSSGHRVIHHGHKFRPDTAGNGNLKIYSGGRRSSSRKKSGGMGGGY